MNKSNFKIKDVNPSDISFIPEYKDMNGNEEKIKVNQTSCTTVLSEVNNIPGYPYACANPNSSLKPYIIVDPSFNALVILRNPQCHWYSGSCLEVERR